jgi:hypothetical protein
VLADKCKFALTAVLIADCCAAAVLYEFGDRLLNPDLASAL